MYRQHTASWQIRMQRSSILCDYALWIRAVERIEAAGPLVPGPLRADLAPAPNDAPGGGLSEGWLAWWHGVIQQADGALDPTGRPGMGPFGPPEFDALAQWPALQEVVIRRWLQGQRWHSERKRAAMMRRQPEPPRNTVVITELERSLDRSIRPFLLELVLLPVEDDVIRKVTDTRYLVPEGCYDGPRWPELLRSLAMSVGG